jgi:hypothetical protein
MLPTGPMKYLIPFVALSVFSCGTPVTQVCVPGKSEACAGVNGCSGAQVCKQNGTGFDSCICGSTGGGSTSSGGGTSQGFGGGTTNSGGGTTNSGGGTTNSGGGTTNSGGGTANSGGGTTNSGGGTANSGGGTTNSGGGTTNFGGGTTNSGGGITNSGGGTGATGGGAAGCNIGFVKIGTACISTTPGYFKGSNTRFADTFGNSISLSADGNTLAVGAAAEDSAATGVNGNQADISIASSNAGAVYVFTRNGTMWIQQAYLKASNTGYNDGFGSSVSLSADGNTLAIGAYGESSSGTGINGNQADNSASRAGAAYVFSRIGVTWAQQAYLKASNTNAFDWFGISVGLSADGNTLAVGALLEDSSSVGIDGNQSDNLTINAGAAYVFYRSGGTWAQQAYVKASNTGAGDYFGGWVSLGADGNTLAVGAYEESSSATGINEGQSDNSAPYSGAVYVFSRSGTTWAQQAYIKASNTNAFDYFGTSGGLSPDGNTLAVGARGEGSSAIGINGNQADNSAPDSGAVYVFVRVNNNWTQQAYLKASNTGAADHFGFSVSLSAGNTLAVGAVDEDSSATGINGNQADNSATNSGAVYVFVGIGNNWTQQAYVKASNTGAADVFGYSVCLSANGNTLAIGAFEESSAATGINGNQADNSAAGAGAVYVFAP